MLPKYTSGPVQFVTRDGQLFEINVNEVLTLTPDNLEEAEQFLAKRTAQNIFTTWNGDVEIRNSLTPEQKECLIDKINSITQRDVDYCLEEDVIYREGHHVAGRAPSIIQARGWSTDAVTQLEEIAYTLTNVTEVEKMVLKFEKNGTGPHQSRYNLAFNVRGMCIDKERKLTISFKYDDDIGDYIFVVTLLRT